MDSTPGATARAPNGQFPPGVSGNPSGARGGAEPRYPGGMRSDGWQSALTGIGTASRDKRLSHTFRTSRLTYQEIIEMWLGDDLATRAIEGPPGEAMRQGWELTISDEGKHDDLKELVEQKVRDLNVDAVVERAWQLERAFGGSAILLGVNDGNSLKDPLNPKSASSLEWLTALEPLQLHPETYYSDPNGPKYGEVETYRLSAQTSALGLGQVGASTGGIQMRQPPPDASVVHESRLIVFGGIRVSNFQRPNNSTGGRWGESVLIRLADILRDFQVAWQSAGIIVVDFSQSVMKIENLMALVAKNPKLLADRFAAVELSRSTARAVLMDSKEEFQRQSTTVTGLPELLDRLSSRVASALDMPLTLLMGQSPKGLGSEGESDVRFYYDKIASLQRRKLAPILRLIIKLIVRSLGKTEPKKWDIRFNPLWQLTDAENAEARLTQARTDSMYQKMGAITSDEIRRSRFFGGWSWDTQVDESKPAPGPVMPPGHGPIGGGHNAKAVPPMMAGAHQVTAYSRKNPIRTKGEPAPSQGGDVALGQGAGAKKDEAPGEVQTLELSLAAQLSRERADDTELDEILDTALSERRNARESRARLESAGGMTPGVARLLDALEAVANAEIADVIDRRANG